MNDYPRIITLSENEAAYCKACGIKRNNYDRKIGAKHRDDGQVFGSRDSEGNDVNGACGEYVLRKAHGWPLIVPCDGEFHAADYELDGVGIQARTRRWSYPSDEKYEPSLLLYPDPKDSRDHIWFAIRGDGNLFRVEGWVWGYIAKNEAYFKPEMNKYFFPYRLLETKTLNLSRFEQEELFT